MLSEMCWVLTPGEAGMRSQALGLAEAVGLPIEEKRIGVRAPWTWLPAGFIPTPVSAFAAAGDRLEPPWPRLVIGCGRRSIGAALAVKRLSGGRTLAAYVQNPEWGRAKFDLVTAMPHDRVSGANVVMVKTALHRISPARLAAARETWRNRLSPDGRPLLGVLVGGDNARYRITGKATAQLVEIVRNACREHGLRAAITPSRRTGADVTRTLADALAAESLGTIWDGAGDNPYDGILALAERLIVTGESISMISEALATGRPVHVLPLEGNGSRHAAFLREIAEERLVSIIEENHLDWGFTGTPAIRSTEEPARRLRKMLGISA